MHKKIPRLPKVSQNNSCAGINSGCHPLQRETAWRGFVDATDISLIERTAVEGGWQVLKRFCWRGGLKIDYTWKYSFFHNCMWRLTQCQRNTVFISVWGRQVPTEGHQIVWNMTQSDTDEGGGGIGVSSQIRKQPPSPTAQFALNNSWDKYSLST